LFLTNQEIAATMKENLNPYPNDDDDDASGSTVASVLELLESELQLAKHLEQESALHLAMALSLDLEPELRKELVSESLKAKQLASDWVKQMELVLQQVPASAKERHSQNC
jgi:hypothetical protein